MNEIAWDAFPNAIEKHDPVWIEMPDGARLAATIWRPKDSDSRPVPAILEYVPYRRHDFTALGDSRHHPWFAGQGYASVRVDCRGSGDSDGIMYDEYLARELQDGADVIAWLAKQPWCSGSVGMMGISWGGFNALQVAALNPPALKAIITCCSTDDRYADDIHYMGGCHITEQLNWASTMFGFNSRPPDPAVVGERWRDMWIERLEKNAPWILEWTSHQRRDAHWTHGSVCEDFAAIRCAVYAVGGWSDGYSNAIPRLLAGLSVPRKGLIGPWGHNYPWNGRPGPAIGGLQDFTRWWDHWLKDEDSGMMDEPMLRAWLHDLTPPAPQYAELPGRWVAEETWPTARIAPQTYVLGDRILARQATTDAALTTVSPQTVGMGQGEWCPYGHAAEHPADQRAEDGQSLTFDTPPLEADMALLGQPVVTLDLSVDRPQAFVSVRLNAVFPDGVSRRLTYGLLNLSHRKSHAAPEPMTPGRRESVQVRLNDLGQMIPAGTRLRVAISTSHWPLVWPSPEPVRLTVHAGTSSLALPVRPPRPEDEDLAEFAPAVYAAPMSHRQDRPYSRSRMVHHDVETGQIVVEAIKDRGRIYLSEPDILYEGAGRERYAVTEGDPLSAEAEITYSLGLQRGDWRIRSETHTHMTVTQTDYVITARLDAYEGGHRVWARTWHVRVPRDHS